MEINKEQVKYILWNRNTLIAIMAMVIFYLIVFKGCNKPAPVDPVVKIETKEVIKQVAKDSVAHARQMDSISKVNEKLTKRTNELREDYAAAQQLVTELLNDATVIIDTSTKQELQAQLEIVKQANATKDSICNKTINIQDSIIANKTYEIVQSQELYSKLRISFNKVVENEKVKDNYIGQLNKKIKRGNQKRIGLKIAIGVLTGALIYQSSK